MRLNRISPMEKRQLQEEPNESSTDDMSSAQDLLQSPSPAESTNINEDSENIQLRPMPTRLGAIGISKTDSYSETSTPKSQETALDGTTSEKASALAGVEITKPEQPVEEFKVPHMSWLELFMLFLSFGFRAWGGPVTQIAMIKQQLVIDGKWISVPQFNRVFGIYQVLPGPEATELCCYFGMIAKGRLGSLIAGLGFILPGVVLVCIVAWLYNDYGVSNNVVIAIMSGVKDVVSAAVLFSVYNLGRHAFTDSKTHDLSLLMLFIGLFGAIQVALNINFFLILALCGVLNIFFHRKLWWAAGLFFGLCIMGFALYVKYIGLPSDTVVSVSGITDQTNRDLFVLGLLAGLMTFGGAYTIIPFVFQSVGNAWLSAKVVADAVALTLCLPTPLVSFIGFIGYEGCGISCCILSIIGVFIPAFSFTLIGHSFFEKLVSIEFVHSLFDGVTAGVIGMVFITALQLIRDSVVQPQGAVIFAVALGVLFSFKHKLLAFFLMVCGGLAGYIMFYDTE